MNAHTAGVVFKSLMLALMLFGLASTYLASTHHAPGAPDLIGAPSASKDDAS